MRAGARLDPLLSYLTIVVVAAVVGHMLTGLERSLWIDELITYWVSADSFSATLDRVAEYQAQGPLYFLLIWGMRHCFGESEIVQRIPSLFAGIGIFVVAYRLARLFVDRSGAEICVLLLAGASSITGVFTSSRPYALAILASLLATYSLVRWIRCGKIQYQIIYFLSLVSMLALHFLFAALIPAHALYVLGIKGRQASLVNIFGTMGASLLVLTVQMSQLLTTYSRQGAYSFVEAPNLAMVVGVALPLQLLVPLLGAAVVGLIWTALYYRQVSRPWTFSSDGIRLTLVLGYGPMLAILAVSLCGKTSIFWDRYLLMSLIYPVFLAGFCMRALCPAPAAWCIAAFGAVTALQIPVGNRLEYWREANTYANEIIARDKPLTIVWMGLVEQEDLTWFRNPKHEAYFLSLLAKYPLAGEVQSWPQQFDAVDFDGQYIGRLELLKTEKRPVLLVIRNIFDPYLYMPPALERFKDRFARHGFEERLRRCFVGICVAEFKVGETH